MSGFSPAEIPILGDKSLPWFDPDWPWNLGRVASFLPCYSTNLNTNPELLRWLMKENPRPIVKIDFSKVSAVAMWAGSKAIIWDDCEPQQILVRFENQWLVLLRHFSEIEVLDYFGGDVEARNQSVRGGLPYPSYVHLGPVGDRSERVISSTDCDECKLIVFNPVAEPFDPGGVSRGVKNLIEQSERVSVKCFAGDNSAKNVVHELAERGFVQSKYWPKITSQFPELNELQDYLIFLDYLYPNGSHPLHGKTFEVAKQSSGADNRADENGAIDAVARSMIWGGEQFNDIPARGIKVLDLLLKAYRDGNRVVSLNEIMSLGVSVDGGMVGQVFKYKSGRHPVSKVIDDLGGGRYRLKHPRKDS